MADKLQALLDRGVIMQMVSVPGALNCQTVLEFDDLVSMVNNYQLASLVGMSPESLQDKNGEELNGIELAEVMQANGVTGVFCLAEMPGLRRLIYGKTLDEVAEKITPTLNCLAVS